MTTKILNQAQAEAVYSAMCALNNVGAAICVQIPESGRYSSGNPPLEVAELFGGVVAIGYRLNGERAPITLERHNSQDEFATAYGLQ